MIPNIDDLSEESKCLYYETAWKAKVDEEIEYFLKDLELASDVKKLTLEQHKDEIYKAIEIVYEQMSYYSAYEIIGCDTLNKVNSEIVNDIKTSIFLTIHGKYRPANFILRRWLETTLFAVYCDYELVNGKSEEILEKRDKWLQWDEKQKLPGISKSGGTVDKLMQDNTNNIATRFLAEDIHSNFGKFIKDLYNELSNKYVHYRAYTGNYSSKDNLCEMRKIEYDFEEAEFFAKYNETFFREWNEYFIDINNISKILILLKFKKIFSLYKEHRNIDFPILEKKQMEKLEELIKSD